MPAVKISRVLVTDPINPAFCTILRQGGLEVVEKKFASQDDLIKELIESRYECLVVRSATQVTRAVIEAAGGKDGLLKLIGRAGVGVDNIDVEAATSNKILVMNAPAGSTISAAEQTCTLIMALLRHTAQACASLKSGKWEPKLFMGSELFGKTLAILGLGRIGREVAIRLQAFGVRTIGYDPLVPQQVAEASGIEYITDLQQIWQQADIITVHTPLVPETRGLVGKEALAKCKRGVRIVNVARGGIVDEASLLESLNSGQVAGAALDVYEQEPPALSDGSATATALIQHKNVLATPHLGASTVEGQERIAVLLAQQIVDLVSGKPAGGIINS